MSVQQAVSAAQPIERSRVESLVEHVAGRIADAPAIERPFRHLALERVFPDEIYAAMLRAMPVAADYRPMSGRSKSIETADGKPARVKIDLFPEYLRHLPPDKQAIWRLVGDALCSRQVQTAFAQRLAQGLEKRFGTADVGLYPIPILTRDIPGYRITPHTDTHWKGITVQLYLPGDESATHVGTIFHERLPEGGLRRVSQIRFAPNSGYAFAVGDDTWHSADPVGPEVETRDSILLTYFVDAGPLRFLRNRAKRIGNFLLNEVRHWTHP